MTRKVLVVGHADADGHIIAEQARRNLARVPGFDVEVLVDPKRTKDHKAWLDVGAMHEARGKDLVFFVDMMFAPSSFWLEAAALVGFVKSQPSTKFFVIDHHPMPWGRLLAENLRAVYFEDVFDCVLGPSSEMMVTAAQCEKQPSRAKAQHSEVLAVRLQGMKRAAAIRSPLAGSPLSALLRADCWTEIEALGAENPKLHPRARNIRPKDAPESEALTRLVELSAKLLSASSAPQTASTPTPTGGTTMAFDSESPAKERQTVSRALPRANPRDLEVIVTLLELAALELTPTPESTFTKKELIEKAKEYGGADVEIRDDDIKLVLAKKGFLREVKTATGKFYRLK